MHATRSSPLDLEVGGEINGVPAGSTRYLTRGDLLALTQTNSYVSDDPNFANTVQIGGVPLEELAKRLARVGDSPLVVAICDDLYRAHYSRAYMSAHHPILVLTINNAGPEEWPKDSQDPAMGSGPFLISHAKFAPSFRVLSYPDERQIPWGCCGSSFETRERYLARSRHVGLRPMTKP